MTTLLVAGRGRCDARCYEAVGGACTCRCEGAYHGIGRERALAQALLELPGEDVVVLPELPLRVTPPGPSCAGCGRSDAAGLRRYGSGLFCRACREAALVLVGA